MCGYSSTPCPWRYGFLTTVYALRLSTGLRYCVSRVYNFAYGAVSEAVHDICHIRVQTEYCPVYASYIIHDCVRSNVENELNLAPPSLVSGGAVRLCTSTDSGDLAREELRLRAVRFLGRSELRCPFFLTLYSSTALVRCTGYSRRV